MFWIWNSSVVNQNEAWFIFELDLYLETALQVNVFDPRLDLDMNEFFFEDLFKFGEIKATF